jgi:3-isopropylmalate/(R)-2-methylmalate dehydratase small subunit
MEPLREHTGRGLVLRYSDVDTDQIIPAEFCKRLSKTGYADSLFARWREEPEFVLNQADRAAASILVAGHNFGTGSSREHAVWALRDWGFRAVIATSFGDIFFRNALKNGLLAVVLPPDAVALLADRVDADQNFEITVDLVRTELRAGHDRWEFQVDSRARWLLLNGFDDVAVTLSKEDAIAGYEQARRRWLPSVSPGGFVDESRLSVQGP